MSEVLSLWEVRRRKVRLYRAASDAEVLACVNDRPLCGFAVIHQALDMPFARREAARRGLGGAALATTGARPVGGGVDFVSTGTRPVGGATGARPVGRETNYERGTD